MSEQDPIRLLAQLMSDMSLNEMEQHVDDFRTKYPEHANDTSKFVEYLIQASGNQRLSQEETRQLRKKVEKNLTSVKAMHDRTEERHRFIDQLLSVGEKDWDKIHKLVGDHNRAWLVGKLGKEIIARDLRRYYQRWKKGLPNSC
jgi:DNA-binding GntR family transcriptional regulator